MSRAWAPGVGFPAGEGVSRSHPTSSAPGTGTRADRGAGARRRRSAGAFPGAVPSPAGPHLPGRQLTRSPLARRRGGDAGGAGAVAAAWHRRLAGSGPPWFTLGEELGALVAPLIGAEPEAVVVTGTTTVNQHALTATFYRPRGERRKIVATSLDFPSDVYALQSLIQLHGGDARRDLILVPSRDGRTIAEDDAIAALDKDVALALLPGGALPLRSAPRHPPPRRGGAGAGHLAGVRLRPLDRRCPSSVRCLGRRLGVLVPTNI